jgi:hypothetical protein
VAYVWPSTATGAETGNTKCRFAGTLRERRDSDPRPPARQAGLGVSALCGGERRLITRAGLFVTRLAGIRGCSRESPEPSGGICAGWLCCLSREAGDLLPPCGHAPATAGRGRPRLPRAACGEAAGAGARADPPLRGSRGRLPLSPGASVVLSVIFSAALDASVLYPFSLRDTLLRRAELELVPSAPGLPTTLVLNQRKRCRPAAGRR